MAYDIAILMNITTDTSPSRARKNIARLLIIAAQTDLHKG